MNEKDTFSNVTTTNDTRINANDTQSVFASINPFKRRVSFRDIPKIREFERPSSSAAPSPLPSGFLETTQNIFQPLLVEQTPTKLLKVDQIANYGTVEEQLNQTHVIQHTPFHTRIAISNATAGEVTLFDTPHKQGAGESLLFTPHSAVDQIANYGTVEEQLNQTHVIQHTPFHTRMGIFNTTGGEVTLFDDATPHKQGAGESLLFTPHTTGTRTVGAIDFEDDCASESPQSPPPTAQLPMSHLNDAQFKQWYEAEMQDAMDAYCEAVEQYMGKHKRLWEEQKRLVGRTDAIKERIIKFRADFSEAEQRNEEERHATLGSVHNINSFDGQ